MESDTEGQNAKLDCSYQRQALRTHTRETLLEASTAAETQRIGDLIKRRRLTPRCGGRAATSIPVQHDKLSIFPTDHQRAKLWFAARNLINTLSIEK